MASLRRKRLSLSEKYKAITEVEPGTKPSKVALKVLTPPLITITKTAVKNLDCLKDLHGRRCLQVLNRFKTAASLRRNRQHFTCEQENFTIKETTDKDRYIFHATISL